MDISYLGLIVVTLLIGVGASSYVKKQLSHYSGVRNSRGITGAQAAQQMLDFHGVTGVRIQAGGRGQDFFDPRTNSITLSPDAYNATSVTALATACHEVGHACQYAKGYTPMKIRGAIVPVANFASNAWVFVLLLGIFMNLLPVVWLSVAMYAAVVLFQLVTLPVEFDASNRALAYMNSCGLPAEETEGSGKVLRACALTYVAAALVSVLQLLWLIGRSDN